MKKYLNRNRSRTRIIVGILIITLLAFAIAVGCESSGADPSGLAAGSACKLNAECGNGLSCNFAVPTANKDSHASCQPLKQANGVCQSRNDCVSGLQCGGYDRAFLVGSCQPFLAEGVACDLDRECTGELSCNYAIATDDGNSPSSCQPLQQADGTCGFHNNCVSGLFCDDFELTGVGSCQPSLAEGAACESNRQCTGELSCNRAMRNSDDEPTCQPLQRTNGACSAFIGDCASGFFCGNRDRNNIGSCQALLAQGAMCEGFNQCVGELVCLTGSCKSSPAPRSLAEDAACRRDSRCAGVLVCNYAIPTADDSNSSSCQPLQAADQACSGTFDCEVGLVCNFAILRRDGNNSSCQPLGMAGMVCGEDSHCEVGFTCNLDGTGTGNRTCQTPSS